MHDHANSHLPRSRHVRAAWLGSAALLSGCILRRVRDSGAVPASEFPPAVLAYDGIPWLFAAGAVLLAWAAWTLRTSAGEGSRRWRRAFTLGALLGVGAIPVPDLILPAVLLIMASIAALATTREYTAVERSNRDEAAHITDAVLRLDPRGLMWVFATLVTLGTLATLILGTAETFFYTQNFVPDLVDPEQLTRYRTSLLGLSVFVGLDVGIALTVALILLHVLLRLLDRWGVLRPGATPWLLGILVGQALAFGLYDQTRARPCWAACSASGWPSRAFTCSSRWRRAGIHRPKRSRSTERSWGSSWGCRS